METRASHVIVGAFVVVLVGGLFAFLIWAAKLQFGEANDYYRIYLTGSVTGLQEGSPVRYRGIPIGTVKDVRIDPDDVGRVRATVEIKHGTPIKSDSVASLETQGLTGGAYIQIVGGTADSPALEGENGNPPVIHSRPSTLSEVVDTAPELLAKAVVVLDRVGALVSPENQEAVAATLANTRKLTDNLNQASTGLKGVLQSVEHLSASLDQKTVPRVDETLLQLQTELKTLTDATVDTEKSLRATSNQVGALVGENRQAIHDFTATGLYDTTQLVNQLRDLSDRLSRFITRLDNDPSNTLFGGTRQGVQVQHK